MSWIKCFQQMIQQRLGGDAGHGLARIQCGRPSRRQWVIWQDRNQATFVEVSVDGELRQQGDTVAVERGFPGTELLNATISSYPTIH